MLTLTGELKKAEIKSLVSGDLGIRLTLDVIGDVSAITDFIHQPINITIEVDPHAVLGAKA